MSKFITPTVMQMEATECGAASLAIILGYYGRWEPLSVLRQVCGVSRDGTKASNLAKAGRSFGMKVRSFSKNIDNIGEVEFPCIIFWEFYHFLVLEKIDGGVYYLNDPARGHRQLSRDEFEAGFTGVVLTFEPTEEFEKKGRPTSPYPYIRQKASGSGKALAFLLIAGVFSVFPTLAQTTMAKFFVDAVMVEANYDWIHSIVFAIVVVLFFQTSMKLVSGIFDRRLHIGLVGKLTADYVWHLLNLPYIFYSQRYVGDVVDRTEINEEMVDLIVEKLLDNVIGIVKMLLFGIVLFSFHVGLASIAVVMILANFYYLRYVSEKRKETFMRIAKEGGKLSSHTISGLSNFDTLKSSGTESHFFQQWAGLLTNQANAMTEQEMRNRVINALPVLTSALMTAIVLIIGGFEVLNGNMTQGSLVAFSALMTQFMAPMNSLLTLSSELQVLTGNVLRLEDVMKYPNREQAMEAGREKAFELYREQTEQPAGGEEDGAQDDAGNEAVTDRAVCEFPPDVLKLEGALSCVNVSFAYSPVLRPVVKNFSLDIRPGERVALVGGSGSGKSTAAKLVAGLIEPTSGYVTLDGVLRSHIPVSVMSNSIAVVEQEFSLFPGTVRDNITLWDDTLPENWVREALSDAVILDDVLALPGGIDAVVGEGGKNMSGGQQQRIEIARALARRPLFLVFDEATSALDAETEAMVMHNLHRRGCAALIIAHRLSTIKSCHRIIVMEKGKIAEQGTHQELLAAKGKYVELLQAEDAA